MTETTTDAVPSEPTQAFAAARTFLRRDGRLLERRLFATLFEGAPATGVVRALDGFRNDDGGFGHGLEPDVRAPDSMAIHVEAAFQAMVAAGAADPGVVTAALDWLASVAAPGGPVALVTPAVADHPRAVHMDGAWMAEPGLNPTAGLVGLACALGAGDHPWVGRATAWCWQALEAGWPAEGHALLETAVFLEHVPDRERAAALAPGLVAALPAASYVRLDAHDPAYGVTPLDLAPAPTSLLTPHLGHDLLTAHLHRLARDQRDDGGWAITWEPPGPGAVLEWRSRRTVEALRTWAAWGCVP